MMRSSERRAIGKLPVCLPPWEVALVDAPFTIQGVETEGLLIVAESNTGFVRSAGPIVVGDGPEGGLWPVLGPAFTAPGSPSSPARPRVIRCADGALAHRLAVELEGADVAIEVVDRTPVADEALDALVGHMRPVSAPGITTELNAWAKVLDAVCRIEPWRYLSDSVTFRFQSDVPELADAVCALLGHGGQQHGIVLYRTSAAYRAFMEMARAANGVGEGLLDVVESFCVYLDGADEFDADELTACRSAGLALRGWRFPRAIGISGGKAASLTEREQRVFLASIEALVGLCATDCEALATESRSAGVATILGPIEITATPARSLRPPPRLVDDLVRFAHSTALGTMRKRDETSDQEMVSAAIKAAKADALRLKDRLIRLDSVRIEPHGPATRGTRWARFYAEGPEGRSLGLLMDTEVSDRLMARLQTTAEMWVCVSAGGSRRPRIDAGDFVLTRLVPFRLVARATEAAEPARPHDPIFDRPRSEWPKISETLIKFATAVFGDEFPRLPPSARLSMLELAATVWNAVVFADFGGEPSGLQEILVRSGPTGPGVFVKALVLGKRQWFAGDPRVVDNVRVEKSHVYAQARVVEGYPL